MLFNSWQFAIFFPIVFLLYYWFPFRYRWTLLLLASYYFYMSWNPNLIVLIGITTVVQYVAAIGIEKLGNNDKNRTGGGYRFLLLVSGVSISLGILFFYKYFNFFSRTVCELLQQFAIPVEPHILKVLLPVGISFYTFQAISYTIDVYFRRMKAETHFGYFALYISFFPQLVAGPIERADRLLPQLKAEHAFCESNVIAGSKQMAIGFFKKLVVADTLAKGVNAVYNDVHSYTGLILVVATVMFAFEIYCDFSGYSDIAIGCAKIMGIDLMENFKRPYFSQSIQEFWSRWHISLSTWFRDYIYIPLGGNRVSQWRHRRNLLLTFLLSGLWHGANWTFVIWGGLHGVYLVVEKWIKGLVKQRNSTWLGKGISIFITFVLVNLAWIFFRANSVADAFYIIGHLLEGVTAPWSYIKEGIAFLDLSKIGLLIVCFEVFILIAWDFLQERQEQQGWQMAQKHNRAMLHRVCQWIVWILFLAMIVILSTKSTVSQFIYFQF